MKVDYITEPSLSPVGYGDEWKLNSEFNVRIDSESGDAPINFRIPEGFSTDLASVPRVPGAFMLFGGKARRAAILHDWLYRNHYPRDMADLIFREAMKDEVPTWARYTMWAGVRLAGGAYYPD